MPSRVERRLYSPALHRFGTTLYELAYPTMQTDSFFRFYANLPINVRHEVILDLGERGPITWEVAYREIKADSDLGREILKKLIDLKFIPMGNG